MVPAPACAVTAGRDIGNGLEPESTISKEPGLFALVDATVAVPDSGSTNDKACILGTMALASPAQAAVNISCSKGGNLNPILQGSGIAGGANCAFGAFPPNTAITVSGGLHLTPTTTNADGVASGVLYSLCLDTLGAHALTFTAGAVTEVLHVTVATNPNFSTDCPTSTTTTTTTASTTTSTASTTTTMAPATTTTTPPAAAAVAVAASPHFTG